MNSFNANELICENKKLDKTEIIKSKSVNLNEMMSLLSIINKM